MRHELKLTSNAYKNANDIIFLELLLENFSGFDLKINKGAFTLHNSLYGKMLKVQGPSHINCDDHQSMRGQKEIILNSGDTIKKHIVLSDVCNFSNYTQGRYEILYQTQIHPCVVGENRCLGSDLYATVATLELE